MTTSSDSDTGEQMCAYVLLEEHSDYLSLTTNRFSTKTHLVMSFYKSVTLKPSTRKNLKENTEKKSTFNAFELRKIWIKTKFIYYLLQFLLISWFFFLSRIFGQKFIFFDRFNVFLGSLWYVMYKLSTMFLPNNTLHLYNPHTMDFYHKLTPKMWILVALCVWEND